MKRSLTLVCLLALTIGAGPIAFNRTAQAQAAEPPSAPMPAGTAVPAAGPSKIAVIAFQQAVMATNEGQRGMAQLRTKYEPKQAALKTQNDEIESLKKQLQDAGSNLNEQERDSRVQTIDQKTKALQRQAEDDQNDFQSDMSTVYSGLAQKVYAVMDAYANSQGYTVVLDASQQQQNTPSPILWAAPNADITKAVIDAYNVKSGVPAQPSTTSSTPRSNTAPRTTTRPTTRTPQTPQ